MYSFLKNATENYIIHSLTGWGYIIYQAYTIITYSRPLIKMITTMGKKREPERIIVVEEDSESDFVVLS